MTRRPKYKCGHTKNSSFGQETRKYADVFALNLLKGKKSSFIKCILNLRFLKRGLLSEFQLYLGLMGTLTSSLYHCFHGNGIVNGILAQSSIHHYRSRNQSRQKLPSGPHTPFHSSAIYTDACTADSFAKDVFNVFFKESSVAAKDQGNGPSGWESTSCMKRAPPTLQYRYSNDCISASYLLKIKCAESSICSSYACPSKFS